LTSVGILSDTHGYFDPALRTFFEHCDELWHAGDWGDHQTVETIRRFKPIKGVYGNIDGREIRQEFEEITLFTVEDLTVCMLHIGGYPGKYSPQFRKILQQHKPDIMVCGHSHILKVMRDEKNNLMHMNPGAAGNKGFHVFQTALRLKIDGKRMTGLEVWEKKRNQQVSNQFSDEVV
jgi:putative phosphoesterase